MALEFLTYETGVSYLWHWSFLTEAAKATLIDLSLGRGIVLLSHKTFHTFVGSLRFDRM